MEGAFGAAKAGAHRAQTAASKVKNENIPAAPVGLSKTDLNCGNTIPPPYNAL
jgi:hypothetical protein